MIPVRIALATLVAGALLGGPALAQGDVLVVDANGGPGVFTELQPAIDAAAEGDVVLVRKGQYAGATISGKSLTLLGERGKSPRITSPLIVTGQGPQHSTAIRGLDVSNGGRESAWIQLRDNEGPVWVEDCDAEAGEALNCDQATFTRCTLASNKPFAGMLTEASQVVVAECVSTGGLGAEGFIDSATGLPVGGGAGLDGLFSQSPDDLMLVGSTFTGGQGGDGVDATRTTPCAPGGSGGNGVRSIPGEGGNTNDSVIWVVDSEFVPGTDGVSGDGCSFFSTGFPFLSFPPTADPFRFLTGTARSVSANSPVREGGNLVVTLRGEPGDRVYLSFGFTQEQTLQPALGGSTSFNDPFFIDTPFMIPGTRELELTFEVTELGPGVVSLSLFIGGGYQDPSSNNFVGSSTYVTLFDSEV